MTDHVASVAAAGGSSAWVAPDAPVAGSTSSEGAIDNRADGIDVTGLATIEFTPDVVSPPADVAPVGRVVAQAFAAPTINTTGGGARPVYTPAYAEAPAHRDRIIVGGKDVTYFRGVVTPRPSFDVIEPFGWGSMTLVFPQIVAAFERPGYGALSWLRPGAQVEIQRVDPETGAVVAKGDYRGVVVEFDHDGPTLSVSVGGHLVGKAALQDRQPPLIQARPDLGEQIANGLKACGRQHHPRAGTETGIKTLRAGGTRLLDWMNSLMAMATTGSGRQWTTMPNKATGVYTTFLKDTTTIDGTVYNDDTRVVASLHRDIAEEPNRIFARGITPSGTIIKFGGYPGLLKTNNPPAFPMASAFGSGTTDADTTSGEGITVMQWRLRTMGYTDWDYVPTGTFGGATERAVKDLQDDVGLTVTGTMTKATWKALWDVSATGYSLLGSQILPAAQDGRVAAWKRSASGAFVRRNPNYDPTRLRVDQSIDFGSGFTKGQMRAWAQQQIAMVRAQDNYAGTITIYTGAIVAGDHTPGDPIADILRTRDLWPGMNLKLPHFAGGIVVHVSGLTQNDDGSVQLVVDTQARDAMTVWSVIQRNRDNRNTPHRSFWAQHKASGLAHDKIQVDEVGGILDAVQHLDANTWTVIPVVMGQAGTVQKIRLETTPAAEYAVAVFGKKIHAKTLNNLVGSPLSKEGAKRWTKPSVRDKLDDAYVLLYAAGTPDDPAGWAPQSKGATEFSDAGDSPTGKWHDDAGFDYVTFTNANDAGSVLWLAIHPTVACKLKPGRVFWPLSEDY
jgi:peptidoglycan hydrolase-like protein with peptidoglycan-binding domain